VDTDNPLWQGYLEDESLNCGFMLFPNKNGRRGEFRSPFARHGIS